MNRLGFFPFIVLALLQCPVSLAQDWAADSESSVPLPDSAWNISTLDLASGLELTHESDVKFNTGFLPTVIVGIVTDVDSAPIEGVHLTLSPSELAAETNSDGFYAFVDPSGFEFIMDLEATGYESVTEDLTGSIICGETNRVDFVLDAQPSVCGTLPSLQSRLWSFVLEFLVPSLDDFDNDGIPESFALALLEATCELPRDDPLWVATTNAFDMNLQTLSMEDDYLRLRWQEDVIASLMLLSLHTRETLILLLRFSEIELEGEYESIEGVYSAQSDFDGDGFSNLDEYTAFVVDGGGNIDTFVDAATDASIFPQQGPGCFGASQSPTELFSGRGRRTMGDLILLFLLLGGLVLYGRTHSARRSSLETAGHSVSSK